MYYAEMLLLLLPALRFRRYIFRQLFRHAMPTFMAAFRHAIDAECLLIPILMPILLPLCHIFSAAFTLLYVDYLFSLF